MCDNVSFHFHYKNYFLKSTLDGMMFAACNTQQYKHYSVLYYSNCLLLTCLLYKSIFSLVMEAVLIKFLIIFE